MRITVRLFAGLRERAGSDHVELELPDDARAGDVLAAMDLLPGQCIVALDMEYASPDEPVLPGHEVALIPPVSGGAADPVRLVEITDQPLDLAAVAAVVRDARAGAVVCFEGVTRDVEALDYEAYVEMAHQKLRAIGEEEAARHGLCAVALVHRTGRVPLSEPSVIVAAGAVVCFEGVTRDVEALDYEAYVEMAQQKLRAIGEEEAARHGLCAVALVHRTGRVPLSEPSVIVAASAAHRGEAFTGARALIDRVKAEAPIWKVELDQGETTRVKGTLPQIPDTRPI